MPENDTADRSEQAEERTHETQSFIRRVRRATRRKYTPEEKIRIVLEGFRREATVSDLCRREGINPANYYTWTKDPSTGSGHGSWRLARSGSPVTLFGMPPVSRSKSSGVKTVI